MFEKFEYECMTFDEALVHECARAIRNQGRSDRLPNMNLEMLLDAGVEANWSEALDIIFSSTFSRYNHLTSNNFIKILDKGVDLDAKFLTSGNSDNEVYETLNEILNKKLSEQNLAIYLNWQKEQAANAAVTAVGDIQLTTKNKNAI